MPKHTLDGRLPEEIDQTIRFKIPDVLKVAIEPVGWSTATHRGLFIFHDDWRRAAQSVHNSLKTRGYVMYKLDNADDGVAALARLAASPRKGDKLFVYLAVHGASARQPGDVSTGIAASHLMQPNHGLFTLGQILPHLRALANADVDVIVFDGSCEGGETVVAGFGEKFAALSSTAATTPGGTGAPHPGQVLADYPAHTSFGLWWRADDTASRLDGYVPFRFYQKIYRNDDTPMARLTPFSRPALFHLLLPGDPWTMEARRCYLWRYLDAARFAKLDKGNQDLMAGSVDAYLASMDADRQAGAPIVDRFISMINDLGLARRAAQSYSAGYTKVWRNLMRDQSWDFESDPIRYTPELKAPIEPRKYAGEQGFVQICGEIVLTIMGWQHHYDEQADLIRRIDAEAHRTQRFLPHLVDLAHPVDRSPEGQRIADERWSSQRSLMAEHLSLSAHQTRDILHFFERSADPQKADPVPIRKLVTRRWPQFEVKTRLGELIDELASLRLARAVQADKLWFLLAIAEEAISHAQETSLPPADRIQL